MEKIRIGFIGLGIRGRTLIKTLLQNKDVDLVAMCDIDKNNFDMTRETFDNVGIKYPEFYTNYNELISRRDIDGVIIATHWITHAEIAIAAMRAGKYSAMEVSGGASIEECWELVRVSKETGMPCMMLENCCYGKNELTVLNMVKKGLFGELVHCECGYAHDLRYMVEQPNNRLYNNMHRNGDLYPTHGVGPIAKILNINRGNRFISLTSMASKSIGLNDWILKYSKRDHELANYRFVKGDVIQTMIKCAHGETVLLTHNVSLPRPYSRLNVIQGTNGIYIEERQSVYFDVSPVKDGEEEWLPIDNYYNEYCHPLWKQYEKEGIREGHGGMDYLVLDAFMQSIANRTETPIDVYDTAVWMAITALSEQSIAIGSMPVPIPDFTNGKWIDRHPAQQSRYALDKVYEDY